jgi:hypothetical protein
MMIIIIMMMMSGPSGRRAVVYRLTSTLNVIVIFSIQLTVIKSRRCSAALPPAFPSRHFVMRALHQSLADSDHSFLTVRPARPGEFQGTSCIRPKQTPNTKVTSGVNDTRQS